MLKPLLFNSRLVATVRSPPPGFIRVTFTRVNGTGSLLMLSLAYILKDTFSRYGDVVVVVVVVDVVVVVVVLVEDMQLRGQ